MGLEEIIDIGVLKSIPNPADEPYEIKTTQPEMTFMGADSQPDHGVLKITMYPNKRVIEFKSLKLYLQQYRMVVVSYERFLNTVYGHLMEVYKPARLKLVLSCNPRGGISSILTIDSKVREKAKDKENDRR